MTTAAERNRDPILQVLRGILPRSGSVLEIASGSGQHVVHFAAAIPQLTWQPTDLDPENISHIDRRVVTAALETHGALKNVLPAVSLDVQQDPWPVPKNFEMIVCINMIHIAPWSATTALFQGAQRHLRSDGLRAVLLYGPYREAGLHTAPSNEVFDRSLQATDRSWGVRDLDAVAQLAQGYGFQRVAIERLPANNLCVLWRG